MYNFIKACWALLNQVFCTSFLRHFRYCLWALQGPYHNTQWHVYCVLLPILLLGKIGLCRSSFTTVQLEWTALCTQVYDIPSVIDCTTCRSVKNMKGISNLVQVNKRCDIVPWVTCSSTDSGNLHLVKRGNTQPGQLAKLFSSVLNLACSFKSYNMSLCIDHSRPVWSEWLMTSSLKLSNRLVKLQKITIELIPNEVWRNTEKRG